MGIPGSDRSRDPSRRRWQPRRADKRLHALQMGRWRECCREGDLFAAPARTRMATCFEGKQALSVMSPKAISPWLKSAPFDLRCGQCMTNSRLAGPWRGCGSWALPAGSPDGAEQHWGRGAGRRAGSGPTHWHRHALRCRSPTQRRWGHGRRHSGNRIAFGRQIGIHLAHGSGGHFERRSEPRRFRSSIDNWLAGGGTTLHGPPAGRRRGQGRPGSSSSLAATRGPPMRT
jgi:hypothetical protein